MTTAPQIFKWDGRVMIPLRLAVAQCAFKVNEVYRLIVEAERSEASHRHYFACIIEAWRNLPEDVAQNYPTPEALRKHALIAAGFYHQEVVDCGSGDVACRVARFANHTHPFAYVIIEGRFVIVRTARSQSRREMTGAEFQQSKTKVLEVLAQLLDTTPNEIADNAERS